MSGFQLRSCGKTRKRRLLLTGYECRLAGLHKNNDAAAAILLLAASKIKNDFFFLLLLLFLRKLPGTKVNPKIEI